MLGVRQGQKLIIFILSNGGSRSQSLLDSKLFCRFNLLFMSFIFFVMFRTCSYKHYFGLFNLI